jgi:uncharacterized membrane protein HdeD (DUF308 family)
MRYSDEEIARALGVLRIRNTNAIRITRALLALTTLAIGIWLIATPQIPRAFLVIVGILYALDGATALTRALIAKRRPQT